ncbi:ribonuclease H-like domain-containing protein [Tanacetum coccineum]|uniref:Ribonuclease H-like domain-containing protein n=1 Tax=Tanacetum coccineum TaxID=301880 RepID=A0ABQ5DB45_9ASTR
MSNQVANCNAINQEDKTVNESLTAELERYKEQVKIFEERHKFDLNDREKYIDFQMRESHKNLSTTVEVLKKETKEKEDKYIEEIVDLEKKKKPIDNIRKQPAFDCGHTLVKKHDPLFVIDSEETLDLAEATRLKMNEKQNDPIVKEKKVNIKLIDYDSLNKLSEHFVAHFVPKNIWAREFDHIRRAFERDVIPFVKSLRESFADFDLGLYREVYEMKAIFEQMETKVEQCSVDRKYFEIEKKELLIENERLLELIISQDIVCTAMHYYVELVKYKEMEQSYIDEYNRCVKLESELSIKKYMPSQPIPKTLNHQTSPRFNSRTHHSAMTNSNTPPPPPALTLVEKLYAVHNINSLVPEKLDLQESNYSTWSYFFKGHCSNFNVLNHIDGSTSTSDPPTDEWITADSIVKSWIFLTLSPTLRKRMISTNPASAKAAWDTIETIFQENKRTRTVALKGELRVIQMGDDTPDAYFSKIDSIITLLTDLGSTMDDDDIVTYAINGLSEKYGSLAQIIAHKDPFPDLATVRTMVTTEEMRLRSKQPILSTSTTSSSPQVLLATSQPRIQDNRNNRDRDARNENKTEICRNFGRGYCRWGTNCRFIHASPKGTNNPRPNSSQHNTRSMQQGPGHTGLNSASQQHLLSLIQAQQNLLAQYGLSISQGQQPVQHNNTMGLRPNAPPGFQQTQPHQPTFGFNGHQQALYSAAVQNQSASSGSTSQETQLPHAFNTLTLQDPANSNWNMDTGASSHLNSSVNNLSTIFNSRIYPSVLVGDGKSIPVTNTGHSTLPTPYRTLHLNNVLITPNIVKNLISVRQFVRENKCTIEFDEFGFSVKDFWTRQILLRCDSMGDLYPVTSSSYPQAFLVGKQTWHQRLGHPRSEVLRSLPFSLSETIVKSPFDIIHSDLWTSPLTSVLGIKYYVLFLHHFSHYLWVYPLRHKSDVLSKFIHFRAYVNNHFNCDIKSLQCDPGGEFDNTALHQLFVTNGISIRFLVPRLHNKMENLNE